MSDNGVPAQPRLACINRQQLVLRSIDVEQFRCRGRLKASLEAMWACLSYNHPLVPPATGGQNPQLLTA